MSGEYLRSKITVGEGQLARDWETLATPAGYQKTELMNEVGLELARRNNPSGFFAFSEDGHVVSGLAGNVGDVLGEKHPFAHERPWHEKVTVRGRPVGFHYFVRTRLGEAPPSQEELRALVAQRLETLLMEAHGTSAKLPLVSDRSFRFSGSSGSEWDRAVKALSEGRNANEAVFFERGKEPVRLMVEKKTDATRSRAPHSERGCQTERIRSQKTTKTGMSASRVAIGAAILATAALGTWAVMESMKSNQSEQTRNR